MKVVNLSDFPKDWWWLRDEFAGHSTGAGLEWIHCSSKNFDLLPGFPRRDSIGRMMAAWEAIRLARDGRSVLVSHGPRPTMYGAALAKISLSDFPHLAYSFNFTNLPEKILRNAMARSFKQVTKFVCFSTCERQLYSEYFDIPLEKIDMIHWSVHPPNNTSNEAAIVSGDYVCALGSQGRDYRTLFAAMKFLPNIRLVAVSTDENIRDLEIPQNVISKINVPYAQALNILRHSRFMVLPLRDERVPCGHVTAVNAMFLGKAIVSANSIGIQDYIENERTGLFYEPGDVRGLANIIGCLWEDSIKATLMGANGFNFAQTHCRQEKAVSYFEKFLGDYAN